MFMGYCRTTGWLGLLLVVACTSRVDAMETGDTEPGPSDTEPDPSASDPSDPSASASSTDTGPPDNDAPFPPSETVECGAGWDQTVGGGALSALGFPRACNPRLEQGVIDGYRCCSTDPATADGGLPAYAGKGIDGSPPLYADAANAAGTWGMCVRTEDIPMGSGLLDPAAVNCPIPCDPTWASDDVAAVCGTGRVCCQTTEVDAKDCAQQDGVWRPVSGVDIGDQSVVPQTNWNTVAHDTHQDPNGTVCLAYAGDSNNETFLECIRTLSVANRRGYCMALGVGQACPGDPSFGYQSACDEMNN